MPRRKPRVGDAVIVRWLDSGLGETAPLKHAKDGRAGILCINETHGRVCYFGECPRLAAELPRGVDSTTLRLAMCSAGDDDSRTDIAAIWWPSVLEVRVWKPN